MTVFKVEPTLTIDPLKLDTVKGRKLEISAITNRCRQISETNNSLLLFILGKTGTGKTLAAHHAIQQLILQNHQAIYKFIGIDGMDQADEDQPWIEMWQELTGSADHDVNAKSNVQKWVNSTNRPTLILFLDNSDALLSRFTQTTIQLFQLATRNKNVLLIANSVMSNITDKLVRDKVLANDQFDKLVFEAYKPTELNDIAIAHIYDNYDVLEHEDGLIVNKNVKCAYDGLIKAASIVSNRTGDPRELFNFVDELIKHAQNNNTKIDAGFVETIAQQTFEPIKDQFLMTLCDHNPIHRPILMRVMNNTTEAPLPLQQVLEIAQKCHVDLGLADLDANRFRPLVQLLIDFQILQVQDQERYLWAGGHTWCQ